MKKVIALLLSGASVAAMADSITGTGAYINANAGSGWMQNVPNPSFALGLNAGYNFNHALAVEGGWTSLPSQQYGQFDSYNIYDAAVKGTIPLGSIFSLYGRLGVATAYSSWSGATCNPAVYQNTGNAWNYGGLAGVGASFNLSKHFALRVEDYAYMPVAGDGGNFGNVNVVTGGVQFNF